VIEKIGLREQKKAQQKWAIMQSMVEALKEKPFHQIKIDDLCHSLKISKVTLFNYFNSKEDILAYFISSWEYTTYYAISQNKLEGKEAFTYLFKSIGDRKEGLNIMLAIAQHLIKANSIIQYEISDYEFYLFDEEAYNNQSPYKKLYDILLEILSVYNLDFKSTDQVIKQFMTGFYGVPICVKEQNSKNLTKDYLEFLEALTILIQAIN